MDESISIIPAVTVGARVSDALAPEPDLPARSSLNAHVFVTMASDDAGLKLQGVVVVCDVTADCEARARSGDTGIALGLSVDIIKIMELAQPRDPFAAKAAGAQLAEPGVLHN